MEWADVAVSAAGTTCWEMCLLGLPAILIGLAPNQRPVAQELDRRGVAVYLDSEGDSLSKTHCRETALVARFTGSSGCHVHARS